MSMMNIAVVDLSAESRQALVERLSGWLRTPVENFPLLPRASIKPLSPHEIKFHAAPDLCILGPGIAASDLIEVARVRKILPSTPLLVCLPQALSTLSGLEQIARLGADDVLEERCSPEDFIRKLILLSRRIQKASAGTLVVVEGAKGGVGTTSLTAALGEVLAEQGKKVTLIDGDFESQDLSRFLQAKPFINDALRALLDEQRPVTDEFVAQCVVSVWEDMAGLCCVPPPPESDDLYAASAEQARIFAAIFESLDGQADVVLVDSGSMRGMLRSVLYRIADTVLFVVNNDPASLFASIDRVERAHAALSAGARLFVVENSSFNGGLSNQLLRDEFVRSAKIERSQWLEGAIPFCKLAARWPASGGTMFSQGSKKVSTRLRQITEDLGLLPKAEESSRHFWLPLNGWKRRQHSLSTPQPTALPDPRETSPEELVRLPVPARGTYSSTEREERVSVMRKLESESSGLTECPIGLLPTATPKPSEADEVDQYITRARIAS